MDRQYVIANGYHGVLRQKISKVVFIAELGSYDFWSKNCQKFQALFSAPGRPRGFGKGADTYNVQHAKLSQKRISKDKPVK